MASHRSVLGAAGAIDYRLARQSLLARYRAGDLARHEVCDAQPLLRRAAAECAEASDEACPVCEEVALRHVTYVFGPRLPAHGRCTSSRAELARLAQRAGEHQAYVVEVCPGCGWNHLVRSYLLGDDDEAPRSRRSARRR